MDHQQIAVQLARRLAAIMPPNMIVLERAGDVLIRSTDDPVGSRSYFSDLLKQDGSPLGLELATLNVLDLVQDYISERTGDPWPMSTSELHGRHPPMPSVRIEGGVLQLGFEVDGVLVLSLEPLAFMHR